MDNCAFSTLQVFVNYGNIMSQILANTSQCHLRHFETKQTFEKLNDQHQVNKRIRVCALPLPLCCCLSSSHLVGCETVVVQNMDKKKGYYEEMRRLQAAITGLPVYLVDECRRIICRGKLTRLCDQPCEIKGKRMPLCDQPVELVLTTDFLLVLEDAETVGVGSPRSLSKTGAPAECALDCCSAEGALFVLVVYEITVLVAEQKESTLCHMCSQKFNFFNHRV